MSVFPRIYDKILTMTLKPPDTIIYPELPKKI